MDKDSRRARRGFASRSSVSRRDFLIGAGGTGVSAMALMKASTATAQSTIKRGGTLITATSTEAPSLDPQTIGMVPRQIRSALIYSNLLQTDADLNIRPDLAESYEVKDNGKQFVFKLRRGVKWHPPVNREVIADDVKFSYERLLKEGLGKASFAPIQGIEVVDKYTVTFHLGQQDASLIGHMASSWYGAIVNRETVEKQGNLNRIAVGTGPFIFERWVADNELALRKNPDYFIKGRPYVDRVVMKVVPDESNIVAGLRTNTIQHALLEDNKNLDVLKNEKNLTSYRAARLGYEMMLINNSVPPFDNPKVRQAMSWAIDREELIKVVAGGYGQLTAPLTPALKQWALPKEKWQHFYKPDVEKAKKLLAEAGFPAGFKATFSVLTGIYRLHTAAAPVIQANLKRIGIDLEIEPMEYGVWAPRSLSRDPKNWLVLTLNTTPGWPDPDHGFYRWFHSKGLNLNNWNDPEVDRLLEEGRRTIDFNKRKMIYDQVQLLFLERVPMTWNFTPDMIDVTQSYVKGFWQHPATYPLSFDQVWLDT